MRPRSRISVLAVIALLAASLPAAQAQNPFASMPATPGTDKPLTGKALPCTNGHINGTLECDNIELLSFLPASALDSATGFDLWGWTDSTTGREFVIIGGGKSTAFVEVTDPVNPKYLGTLPLHGNPDFGIPGIKVYKNYAFIVAEIVPDHGIQVFDLTQLLAVKNAPAVFQETAHYDNFGSAHTITLNPETGFAYPAGSFMGGESCNTGLHMVDIRTPLKPTFAGCYADLTMGAPTPGYVHDAQCVVYRGPDAQYKGHEICVTSTGSGVGIVDVTDKKQPKRISTVTYPNVGYPHQGWFTADQRYFFLDDEGDESATAERVGKDSTHTRTLVFDFNDLDDPVVLTEFFNPKTSSTDHNLYINGHYMYQGNYSAGLRIIDVADPKHPKEAGYLTKAGTAWGTYPFLKNGTVAVSMNTGLFLARLRSQ